MIYTDFLSLIKANTSNKLGNYKQLCRFCLGYQHNKIDITDANCSFQKQNILNNYTIVTKEYVRGVDTVVPNCQELFFVGFQLSIADEYPTFVCCECMASLHSYALFAEQIVRNTENWKTFLKNCSDVKDYYESSKVTVKTEGVDFVYFEESYENAPTPSMTQNALEQPSKNVQVKVASAKVGKKDSRTIKLKRSFMNTSTEFERTCKICDVPTFSSLARMHSHQKEMHPGMKIYCCDICGHSFISKVALNAHMKDRHGNSGKKHQCQFCAKLFFSDREVKGHEQMHWNTRSYVCKLCGKGFNQKTTLNVHMKSKIHNIAYAMSKRKKCAKFSGNKKKTYRCTHCVPSTVYKNLEELATHRNEMHKIHDCDICKNSFITQESLNSHKLLHSSKPRPYTCSVKR